MMALSGLKQPPFKHDLQELPNGELVWNGSLVLLKYLQEKGENFWRGKKVLEVGSGAGHLGYDLSLMGCDVTCTEMPGKMIKALEESITDLETKVPRKHGSVTCKPLLWGEEGWKADPLNDEYDIIIAAEVVFHEGTHRQLLWTLGKASNQNTEIYSIFLNRPFSWNFFVIIDDDKLFRVEQIEGYDEMGLDDVHMHILRPFKDEKAEEQVVEKVETAKEEGGLEVETATEKNGEKKEEEELSLFELIDQLLGINAEKLQKWVNASLGCLLFISLIFIKMAIGMDDYMMAALHGGFFTLVLCLGASVNWVIMEAHRLEAEKRLKDGIEDTKDVPIENKKTQ